MERKYSTNMWTNLMKKLLTLSLLAASCGLAATSFAAGKPQLPPTIVNITPATTQMWSPSVRAIGQLQAHNGTNISAEAAGRITAIHVKSGQMIQQGQPILEIFPGVLNATLKQQQAQLIADSHALARDKRLIKIGAVSQATYDDNLSKVQQGLANIESTKAQLSQHVITAPFTGKVGLVNIHLGQYLSPGDAIIDLQQLNPLYIDFSVPGSDIAHIKLGTQVTVHSRAYPAQTYTGKVYAANSSIDSDTRMLNLQASVDNPHHELLPGGFVMVSMPLSQPSKVVIIPQTAIVYSEQGPYVYLQSPQHIAIKTPIVLGTRLLDNNIIVLKGIKPGDNVINGGQLKLTNGAPALTQAEAAAAFGMAAKEKKH
jgi:membrane fusion protein, multidrug efflux system